MIVNANSIVQLAVQIKYEITINVNEGIESFLSTKRIIAGILEHVLVRIVGT